MNEDPRLILTSRRPGGLDDREPEVAAALATLADDPALAEWAKNETATDQKITDALRTVQPPAGLRERILTGARVSRPTASAGGGSWFERRAFGILRYSELVALAAVLTLLGIALAYNYFGQTADDRPWQVFAVAKAAEIESGTTDIDHQDSFLASTAGWLTEHACPAPSSLPKGLGKLPLFGCSAMKWNGKPMGIVCFSIGDKKEIHLVSIDARNIPDTLDAEPRWTEVSGYTSAQWVQDGTAYMLIGRLPRATLEPLLAQKIASVFTASFASYL